MIEKAQYMFGGMVTFLEAENEERLLSFYRDNRFSQFDTRQTVSDTDESHELVQLLRLLWCDFTALKSMDFSAKPQFVDLSNVELGGVNSSQVG